MDIRKTKKETTSGKEKEEDRRLAFIGLAANTFEKKTECPSSEELAALIDSSGGGDKLDDTLLHHITHCEQCYEEWLFLSKEAAGGERKKVTIFKLFSTPRALTAAGSAMALAVCIVLFFAIPHHQVTRITAPQEMESIASLNDEEGKLSHEDKKGDVAQLEVSKVSSAPILDIAVRERNSIDKGPIQNEMVGSEKKKMASAAPQVLNEAPASFAKISRKPENMQETNETEIKNFSQFKDYLEQICLGDKKHDKGENYFELLKNRAEYLIAHRQLTEEELLKVEAVVSLLKSESAITDTQFCQKATEAIE